MQVICLVGYTFNTWFFKKRLTKLNLQRHFFVVQHQTSKAHPWTSIMIEAALFSRGGQGLPLNDKPIWNHSTVNEQHWQYVVRYEVPWVICSLSAQPLSREILSSWLSDSQPKTTHWHSSGGDVSLCTAMLDPSWTKYDMVCVCVSAVLQGISLSWLHMAGTTQRHNEPMP